MTNEKAYAPVSYGCNGVAVKFSFPWKILTQNDITVYLKEQDGTLKTLKLGVDYSVKYEAMGGEISTLETYAIGNTILIYRNVSNLQSKSYSTSPGFQASEIEKSFDSVSCNLQEMDWNIENFKTTFSTQIENEIDNLEGTIQDNRQEVLTIQERFEDEVNTKLEEVSEAAGKIAEFEESIEIAVEASNIATQKAQEATNAVVEIENKIVANDVKMASSLASAQSAANSANATLASALKKNQITNCLLEIPQTINLEIVDGELVLKKGSTFILPNGAGSFERITTTTDLKRATFGTGTHNELYIQMHIPNSTGIAGLSFVEPRNITVGTVQPEVGMWYNTTTNQIVNYTSSGAENAIRSFPVAVVKTQSGVVTEIKQVFNGLGHFGIARFVDANVKMLIPNGRNTDGTLKNIEYTTTKVAVTTDSKERTNEDLIIASNGSIGVRSKLEYDKQANKNYNHITGNYEYNCVVAKFSTTTTQTTMFEPKQTFRAVDWFDFSNAKGQLDETTANLNNRYLVEKSPMSLLPSWWEVYSDGLIRQGGIIKKGSSIGSGGQWDSTVTLLKNYSDTDYQIFLAYGFGNTTGAAGQEFRYESKAISSFSASLYNRNGSTSMSADIELNWEAQGY